MVLSHIVSAQCTIKYLKLFQSILMSAHKAVLTAQGLDVFYKHKMKIPYASILHHKETV